MLGRFKRWLAKLEHKKGQMTMENGLSNALMFVVLVIAVGVGGNYPRRYSDRTNSQFCSSEYHGNWFAWSNFILWTIPECWSCTCSSSYSNSLDCWIRNVLQERIEGKTNYWAGNRPPKLILWAGVFA